jgi:hypothetical protein
MQASVTAIPQDDASSNVSTSCSTNADCQNLNIELSAGTYAITVSASGYKGTTLSETFTPNGCCGPLVPATISFTLVPD